LLGHRIGHYTSRQPLRQVYPSESFHDALIRQELLSNIEQS
jgi:hypothetical protein